MQDPLDALRRAYGEPDASPERLAPEAQAETDLFSTLKAGLDALPAQRPDPATLGAVAAAAETMDALDALPKQAPDAATLGAVFAAAEAAPLAALRAAYEGEGPMPDSPEAAAFAALKAGLDALPAQRPDTAAFDAVLAAAAPSAPAADRTPRRATDRAPQRLVTRRRLVVALGTAFALMLVLTSGLWLPGSDLTTPAAEERLAQSPGPADVQENESPDADEAALLAEAQTAPPVASDEVASSSPSDRQAPVGAQATPPSAPAARAVVSRDRRASAPPVAAAPPAASGLAAVPDAEVSAEPEAASFADGNLAGSATGDLTLASDEALPLADGDEALRQLYLRALELQAAQAGLGWDGPPDALGAAPDSFPTATGWMQVRVER